MVWVASPFFSRQLYTGLFVLALSGCATAPWTPAPASRPAQAESAPFAINGRIAVNHNKQRNSANLRWTHTLEQDEILLFAPLGQTVARIQRKADGIKLDTADQHYQAADAEELTQRALGWRLPLSGLQYWILALPAPGIFTAERNSTGQISVLYQDGWTVRYPRYAASAPDSLPLHLVLQREELEIQVLINEWEI